MPEPFKQYQHIPPGAVSTTGAHITGGVAYIQAVHAARTWCAVARLCSPDLANLTNSPLPEHRRCKMTNVATCESKGRAIQGCNIPATSACNVIVKLRSPKADDR